MWYVDIDRYGRSLALHLSISLFYHTIGASDSFALLVALSVGVVYFHRRTRLAPMAT